MAMLNFYQNIKEEMKEFSFLVPLDLYRYIYVYKRKVPYSQSTVPNNFKAFKE